jgi:hypothetical protein
LIGATTLERDTQRSNDDSALETETWVDVIGTASLVVVLPWPRNPNRHDAGTRQHELSAPGARR